MSGFTKLKSSIIHSTVWREENHVRILWITMLAMSDGKGVVESSIPGLSDAARIDIKECEDGLSRLMSPDPYSRTKSNDGRRIAEIDGGWKILNFEKHREPTSTERVKAWREKKRKKPKETNVTVSNGFSVSETGATASEAEAEAEADTEADTEKTVKHAHTRATCSKTKIEEEFNLFWEAYPKKVGKKNALKAFQKARKTDLPEIGVLVPIIEKQKLTTQWRRDNGQFIPNPSTWLNQGRWDDEQQSVDSKPLSKAEQIHQQNMVVLQKYIGGDTNGYNRGHRETTCEAITVVPRKNNR